MRTVAPMRTVLRCPHAGVRTLFSGPVCHRRLDRVSFAPAKEYAVAKKVSVEAVFLLQLGVALFLATLGIVGITRWNSNAAEFVRGFRGLFGQASSPVALIIAIVELTAGVVVAAALFFPNRGRLAYGLTLFIVILWLAYIVVDVIQKGFEPDVVGRLNELAANVVILMALWVVNRRYA
jgi:hypothetical protein